MTGPRLPDDGFPPFRFGDAAERARRLRDIQDVVGSLRQPVEAPDLTAAILSRVDQERPFASARTRNLVYASRVGLAASLGVVLLGLALLHRSAPELVNWVSRPQPLSDVVESAKAEATTRVQNFRVRLASVGDGPWIGAWHGDVVDVELPAAPTLAAAPVAEHASEVIAPPLSTGATSIVSASTGLFSLPSAVSMVEFAVPAAPRALLAEERPMAGYWGGRLSTAPVDSAAIPVVLSQARKPASAASRPQGASRPLHRAHDAFGPAGLGMEGGEPFVPR